MRTAIATLLLSVGLWSHSATASTPELARAATSAIPWNVTKMTVDQRKGVAVALDRYWASFAGRLPRLSPAEAEWLKGELMSGDRNRMSAVFGRREFALRELLKLASGCQETYRAIAERAGTDPRWEAVSWVSSLNCYRVRSDTASHLKRAGLTGFDIDDLYLWEAQIINSVVPSVLYP